MTGKLIWVLDEIAQVLFSPDSNKVLLLWRHRPALRLCDIATKKIHFEIKLPLDEHGRRRDWMMPSALAFSPDGQVLVMALPDGYICFLDVATGKERFRFLSMPTPESIRRSRSIDGDFNYHATGLAFSADSQWLAVGGTDGFLRIWETRTRRELRRLHGHEGLSRTLAFTGDGRRLVSFADGEGILWDPRPKADGQPKRALEDLWADLASDDAALPYRACGAERQPQGRRSAGHENLRCRACR